jgi:hypothetical protein
MGACCSTSYAGEDEVILLSRSDGAVMRRVKKTLSPFQGPQDPTFVLDDTLVAGPHCNFIAPKRSPQGIKPFVNVSTVLDPLRNHPLFHGGEQLLFVAWANVQQADGGHRDAGARLVVLTGFGRLFIIKGSAVQTTCHALEVGATIVEGNKATLHFVQPGREPWSIAANIEIAGQLATLLWVCSSTAHCACLM